MYPFLIWALQANPPLVEQLSRDEIAELFELRLLVEPHLRALAVPAMTEADRPQKPPPRPSLPKGCAIACIAQRTGESLLDSLAAPMLI